MKIDILFVVGLALLAGSFLYVLNGRGYFRDLPGSEIKVVDQKKFQGSEYLIWSNGEVTVDPRWEREFILRALSAQSELEKKDR